MLSFFPRSPAFIDGAAVDAAAASVAARTAGDVVVEDPHLHSEQQQQEAIEEFLKKTQGRKMREKRKRGLSRDAATHSIGDRAGIGEACRHRRRPRCR